MLKSQEYKVQRIVVEAGDEVAVELGCGGPQNAFRKTRPSPAPPGPGLVLGYSRMNKKKIREGIRLLSEVFWLPDYASHKR
jgi:hypothetical protein